MNLTNWRTSLFGTLAVASAYISQNPSVLDAVFDPPLAKKIAGIAFLISGILACLNAKDKQVSGNGTVNAPLKVDQGDGTSKTLPLPLSLIAALLLPALALSGCTSAQLDTAYNNVQNFQANPKVQKSERAAGMIALDFLLAAAKTKANGGQFDSAWAIGAGLNSLADVVPSLTNQQAATVITNTAQAFSGDTSTRPLAQKLAAAYVAANPQTPAEKTATVVAIATGTQNGTANATSTLP